MSAESLADEKRKLAEVIRVELGRLLETETQRVSDAQQQRDKLQQVRVQL